MATGNAPDFGSPLASVVASNDHAFAQSPGGHVGLAQLQGIFQAGHEALSGGELAIKATCLQLLYTPCRAGPVDAAWIAHAS